MIATATIHQKDAGLPGPHPQEGRNAVLVSFDGTETRRLTTWLDDIYRLFLAATEARLSSVMEIHSIHLIIIDTAPATIPNAIRLCSRLKSTPPSMHIPVILLIPGHNPQATIDCLRAGADACMEKPLTRDHLSAQVRNLLANRLRLKNHLSQPLTPAIGSPANPGQDQPFALRLNNFISANLQDTALNVDGLAAMMNMSKPTLYRKIKSVSQQTPNGLVNYIRLNKAAQLLSAGEHKVFKIAQLVGFSSRSNFGKAFLKQFGLTPTEYAQRIKKE